VRAASGESATGRRRACGYLAGRRRFPGQRERSLHL